MFLNVFRFVLWPNVFNGGKCFICAWEECVVVQFLSCVWLFAAHGLQYARCLCPPLSAGDRSNSCPLHQWFYLTISFFAPSHTTPPPTPPSFCAFNLSQHQGLFQWVGSSHQVAKELELQLQHQSFQWILMVEFLPNWLFDFLAVQWTLKSLLQHHSLKTLVLYLALSQFYGPNLTSIHDYWKNHSFDCTDLCRQSDVSAF